METVRTNCLVVGGGPAGVMLGYLLARAGVPVTVLEKHRDFFRDFRGDTVHPSTLQLMNELGLLEELLQLPHQTIDTVRAMFGNYPFEVADLKSLDTVCPYLALMPQWDFLNFLSRKAKQYPEFDLRMEHEAVDLLRQGERVIGAVAKTPNGLQQFEADLVVACDGRSSISRQLASLPVTEKGVPIDVLWFRIDRPEHMDGPMEIMGIIDYGKMLVLLDRSDYLQAGLIIQKGSFEEIEQDGLDEFRRSIVRMAPELEEGLDDIIAWDQIKLLSVQINRLDKWHMPGLLCIGDAAHAMSPAFGVGVNLAIQDAVAAANLLAIPLKEQAYMDDLLPLVQERREFPTRVTQRLQLLAHKGFAKVFKVHGPMRPPTLLKLITRVPGLQSFVARVIGMGVRPEHVHTRDMAKRRAYLS